MAETPKGPGDDFGLFVAVIAIIAIAIMGSGRATTQISQNSDYTSDNTSQSSEEIRKETERKTLIGSASPLEDSMSLEQGNLWSENPDEEYLVIDISPSVKGKTLLTGLELRSAVTGAGVPIGKGVYRYGFSRNEVEDPIYVNPGDKIYVVSGKSPVGYSFQVNKCSGYLTQSNTFNPAIYTSCPPPNQGNLPPIPIKWRNACYNYLESLPSCFMPLNDLPEDVGPECIGYATTEISYNKCVENHQNDKDFYTKEWRVYLNRPEDTWLDRRELIKLLDINKKTIDYIEI